MRQSLTCSARSCWLIILFSLSGASLLGGCTPQPKTLQNETGKPATVIWESPKATDLPFDTATEIALAIARKTYKNASLNYADRTIDIAGCIPSAGCAQGSITPTLLVNTAQKQQKVSLAFTLQGTDSKTSIDRQKFLAPFTLAYKEEVQNQGGNFSSPSEYTRQERALVEKVSTSIPSNLDGFVKWLRDKKGKSRMERVYEFSNSDYTIGIFHDATDSIYPFKGIVLKTKLSGWTPGEIKMRFNKLTPGETSFGRYLTRDKKEVDVKWDVYKDGISAKDLSERKSKVILLPINIARLGRDSLKKGEKQKDIHTVTNDLKLHVKKNGSAWLVAPNYLVTDTNIITYGESFYIRIAGNYTEARLIASDSELGLAALKVDSPINAPPIPLPQARTLKNGATLYSIGYPDGTSPDAPAKLNHGIISAQMGQQTRTQHYQISIPLVQGDTGGPVFTANGSLAGVASLSSKTKVSLITKNQFLKMFLTTNNIPFTEETHTPAMSPTALFEKYQGSVFILWNASKI